MNFHWLNFLRKPHTEVRFVAATKAENEAARTRANLRRLELSFAVSHLTDEQKARAVEVAKRGRG